MANYNVSAYVSTSTPYRPKGNAFRSQRRVSHDLKSIIDAFSVPVIGTSYKKKLITDFSTSSSQNHKILVSSELYQNEDNWAIMADESLKDNLATLDDISNLEANWNGYGAQPISKQLINKTKKIIIGLKRQPELFPTAAGTIQLEYDGENGSYLEIQICESRASEVFCIEKNGGRRHWTMDPSAGKVNEVVKKFYG